MASLERGMTRSARGKAAIRPGSVGVPSTQSPELDAAAQLTSEQAGPSRLRSGESGLEDLDEYDDDENRDDPEGSQRDQAHVWGVSAQ
jgi:hypothetical protein